MKSETETDVTCLLNPCLSSITNVKYKLQGREDTVLYNDRYKEKMTDWAIWIDELIQVNELA